MNQSNQVDSYAMYSRFYDQLESAPQKTVDLIKESISTYAPHIKSMLEIACGTGNVLEQFASDYHVAGLDLSEGMLKTAKQKLPNIPLYHEDMTNFSLDETFDCIYCVYDSINHLLTFEQWADTFASVSKHLNQNGIFIVDMNTPKKLKDAATQPAYSVEFQGNYMMMKVNEAQNGVYDWDIKIFEKTDNGLYRLNNEVIQEVSFSVDQVRKQLEESFEVIDVINADKTPATEESKRVFFICKKK